MQATNNGTLKHGRQKKKFKKNSKRNRSNIIHRDLNTHPSVIDRSRRQKRSKPYWLTYDLLGVTDG